MARGHVYSDLNWLTAERLAEKQALADALRAEPVVPPHGKLGGTRSFRTTSVRRSGRFCRRLMAHGCRINLTETLRFDLDHFIGSEIGSDTSEKPMLVSKMTHGLRFATAAIAISLASATSAMAETITVTDIAGRTVEVEKDPFRIVHGEGRLMYSPTLRDTGTVLHSGCPTCRIHESGLRRKFVEEQ